MGWADGFGEYHGFCSGDIGNKRNRFAAGYTAPVATFLASMGAFATTAPAGSVMVPVMVPRFVWANAAKAQRDNTAAATTWRMHLSRLRPYLSFEKLAEVYPKVAGADNIFD